MKKLNGIEKGIVAIVICFGLFSGGSQLIEAQKSTLDAGSTATQSADNIQAIIDGLDQQ